MVQCDYLVLKDVAATSGLKVLSMYVRPFGYGMSTVVEMKGATDTFAAVWAVKMLNCLGLSDIIRLCDPEPSLVKWVRVWKCAHACFLSQTLKSMSPHDHGQTKLHKWT